MTNETLAALGATIRDDLQAVWASLCTGWWPEDSIGGPGWDALHLLEADVQRLHDQEAASWSLVAELTSGFMPGEPRGIGPLRMASSVYTPSALPRGDEVESRQDHVPTVRETMPWPVAPLRPVSQGRDDSVSHDEAASCYGVETERPPAWREAKRLGDPGPRRAAETEWPQTSRRANGPGDSGALRPATEPPAESSRTAATNVEPGNLGSRRAAETERPQAWRGPKRLGDPGPRRAAETERPQTSRRTNGLGDPGALRPATEPPAESSRTAATSVEPGDLGSRQAAETERPQAWRGPKRLGDLATFLRRDPGALRSATEPSAESSRTVATSAEYGALEPRRAAETERPQTSRRATGLGDLAEFVQEEPAALSDAPSLQTESSSAMPFATAWEPPSRPSAHVGPGSATPTTPASPEASSATGRSQSAPYEGPSPHLPSGAAPKPGLSPPPDTWPPNEATPLAAGPGVDIDDIVDTLTQEILAEYRRYYGD